MPDTNKPAVEQEWVLANEFAHVRLTIDTNGNELLFGKGKPLLHLADTRYVPLTGISCWAKGCVAVDEEGSVVILKTTAGKKWSHKHIDPYRLTAVSCTSIGFCLAVDDAGGSAVYNAGAFSAVSRAVRKSLAIRLVVKPAAKARETTCWRPFTSVELLLPLEVLNTSTMVPGSRPKACRRCAAR